jgi:hypothetical protein
VPTSARHYSAILSSSTSPSAHTKDFASLVRRKRNTLLRSERMFFPQRYLLRAELFVRLSCSSSSRRLNLLS